MAVNVRIIPAIIQRKSSQSNPRTAKRSVAAYARVSTEQLKSAYKKRGVQLLFVVISYLKFFIFK